MQLYVADYLGDTRHLTTEQHGAYLLLLMTMWRSDGALPNDDKKLARIAGCTASRWAKIKGDVLEFFDVEGDALTHGRLKFELEKAQEKSIKRAEAGTRGGKAKALKTKKPAVAKATGLLCHSSEPEPEEPPSPQTGEPVNLSRFSKALSIAADAGCRYETMCERIHQAQPVVEGRRKTTMPDVERALGAALKRGGLPSAIWAAVQAYYALPASTKDGGQYASGAAVVLNKDRWKEFAAPAVGAKVAAVPAATFDGPPEVRSSIVTAKDEDFARRYVDHYCRWRAEDRTLLARTPAIAATLRKELAAWAERCRVRIEVAAANDTPAISHGAAA